MIRYDNKGVYGINKSEKYFVIDILKKDSNAIEKYRRSIITQIGTYFVIHKDCTVHIL
jgi:hypothetical protein